MTQEEFSEALDVIGNALDHGDAMVKRLSRDLQAHQDVMLELFSKLNDDPLRCQHELEYRIKLIDWLMVAMQSRAIMATDPGASDAE